VSSKTNINESSLKTESQLMTTNFTSQIGKSNEPSNSFHRKDGEPMRILKGETETLNQVEAFARYNIASNNHNNIGN
jgi:hypothetical protein